GTGRDQRRLDLTGVRVHAADDVLQVQDDVRHVLLDPVDGGELVRHAFDPNGRHGGADERGEKHAAKRVAERVAEATVERLHGEAALVVLDVLGCDLGYLKVQHLKDPSNFGWRGPRGPRRTCSRPWPRTACCSYFE